MTYFYLDWKPSPYKGGLILKLNDEWTLLSLKFGAMNVVQIKRKSTANQVSVSGELKIIEIGIFQRTVYQAKFSEKIFPNANTKDICSAFHYNFSDFCSYAFQGSVKITENRSERVDKSQNKESKEEIHKKHANKEESKKAIQVNSTDELVNDFGRLLDPEAPFFADVTLKCNNDAILAHKNILSVRSPVFAAMFANPTKESFKNEVLITDMNISTLKALLIYMYTGKFSVLTDSSTIELMFAADKYQLQSLKALCSDVLKDRMSHQNVLRILVVGDMLDENLKSFAMDYICNNCTDFSVLEKTKEWENLRKEHPALSIDVLSNIVKYVNKK